SSRYGLVAVLATRRFVASHERARAALSTLSLHDALPISISAAEARRHPQRNVITRAVGTGAVPEIDFWMLRAGGSEELVLCSDGLFSELDDAEIADVVAAAGHPHEAAATLLDRAVGDGGANDNVSVVV